MSIIVNFLIIKNIQKWKNLPRLALTPNPSDNGQRCRPLGGRRTSRHRRCRS